MFELLDTGLASAESNMEFDSKLLDHLKENDQPILHFYDWDGLSASYGHFIDPYMFLSKEGIEEVNLNLAKRPTGGGIVLHTSDYAFSCLIPSGHPKFGINTLDNYELINCIVIEALQKLMGNSNNFQLLPYDPKPSTPSCQFFCMAKATKYDVMIEGKKVGGAAQRRKKQGFLHQGTISIAAMPKQFLNKILLPDSGVLAAMVENTYTLLGDHWTQEELEKTRLEIKKYLIQSFENCFS